MSDYTNAAAIYSKIPQPRVIEALDDDGDGQIDAGALDQIIANASLAVDGALQSRYSGQIPFDPIPPFVAQCALIFACEDICRRREITGDKNPFTAEAKALRDRLDLIAKRIIPLDPDTEPEAPGAKYGGPCYVPGRLDPSCP